MSTAQWMSDLNNNRSILRQKRQRRATEPPLTELVLHLQTCLREGETVLRVLTSASEAAKLVAQEQSVATYQESYLGWRHWYRRGQHSASLESFREEVLRETNRILQESNLSEASAGEAQLTRLHFVHDNKDDDSDDNNKRNNNQTSPISLPHPDVVQLLEQLQPVPNRKPSRRKAHQLAEQLSPMLEHDNGKNGKDGAVLDFLWIDSETGRVWREDIITNDKKKDSSSLLQDQLAQLIFRLWQCAFQKIRAITLSLRVTTGTRLHQVCQALEEHYQMSTTICPANQWCVGPPLEQAKVESVMTDNKNEEDDNDEQERLIRDNRLPYGHDQRYYLIIGTPGALTRSHWDRGVQTVLYHTIAGTNHALAVPRKIALMLQAVNEAISGRMCAVATGGGGEVNTTESDLAGWADDLELQVLQTCQHLTRAGTFCPGESMLILPGGGHTVLTGDDGKVVLAGEWHRRTDVSF